MTTLLNHPRVEMMPRSAIQPNAKNPRTHGDKQLELLTESLRRFGFVVPIIIDDQNRIVAGNARWAAAGRLALEEVPVIRVGFLSEADRRAFALAENRLAELGGWNEELLSAELEFLFETDYDFSVTGFDLKDLDLSIGDEPVKEEPVELPAADAVAVSRTGDLWLIGPHRLYCGNARETVSYEALVADERAAMIIGDLPYNLRIAGHVSGQGKVVHREFAEASGEMSPGEFTAFLRAIFRQCVAFSRDGSIHFHCMDWRHIREILDAADGIYTEFKQLIVWNKNNGGLGTFYRQQHELVFAFKSGRASHTNNFELGQTGRYRTNVWDYAGCNTFRKGRQADLAAHSTVKPLAMIMDAILDCSVIGDLILDPTCGSGTTLAAAHKTRRRGAGIEIDPIYVDTALRRLTAISGLVARLPDGRGFDEVAADRAAEVSHG